MINTSHLLLKPKTILDDPHTPLSFLSRSSAISSFPSIGNSIIYIQGSGLAQKHRFRFLIYKFEDLVEPNAIAYDPKNYPLPDNANFEDYINFLIKDSK